MIATRPDFKLPLALRLANSALHAYDTPDQIKARGDIPIYEPRFDLQAVIEPCHDCTILSYRGTRSAENWKVDLDAIPNYDGVHSGFYEAFGALDKLVAEALPVQFQTMGRVTLGFDRSKPLYIDGHSLGGALAVLGAVRYHPDAIYTYNQPRLFTHKYAAAHKDLFAGLNWWKIVDREEIISHLPGLLAGYRHAGGLALITDDFRLLLDPPELRQLRGHCRGIAADLFRIFYGRLPQWVIAKEHCVEDCLRSLQKAVV